ncbi:agmatinase [Rhodobium orientis]|uniref:Agmatinase n=1 Tax=Rhodobium orientis TaxID=34017 RepID=A0A327JNV6_9HYPH|nr:agmatinase [Rhodobium orientis]MBB4302403.1 agmatinase [Rhodobium orientis]MBK5949107.1 agmatinase [Rhodobium orientis]RAI26572.1 agmatinase [Rhodobium orientis]
MSTKSGPPRTDNAVHGTTLYGGSHEPAYCGALSFMRRRYSRHLDGVDVAVWGIPFDAAVSDRPGARFGPQGIRKASATFCGDPNYPFAFDIFETLAVVDYGDCAFDYARHQEIPGHIRRQAGTILDAGCHLFSMGGDHYVTWPLLQAHAERHGPLAIVQFDAHQDTWDDDGDRIDHGTMIARAVKEGIIDPAGSIQIGIRSHAPDDFGIEIVYGDEIETLGVKGIIDAIVTRVGDRRAYMTFDIDCLDPAFAPGTGTPVAGGLSSREALSVLRGLGAVEFVGGDVVEVAPAYDHADVTSLAAASIAQTYLGLLAERRRNGS